MASEFKKLIQDIKCGNVPSPAFTEDDLAKVKSCLPEPVAQPAKQIEPPAADDTPSCVNDGVDQIKQIMIEQMAKQGLVIELSILKGKLEESLDHYRVIQSYYSERVKFFNDTITTVTPFTSQYLYWDTEIIRLTTAVNSAYQQITTSTSASVRERIIAAVLVNIISENRYDLLISLNSQYGYSSETFEKLVLGYPYSITAYSTNLKTLYDLTVARVTAYLNKEVAKQGATNALGAKIQTVSTLGLASSVETSLKLLTSQISGQLLVNFSEIESQSATTGIVIPARTATYGIRTVDLNELRITVPQVKPDGTSEPVERVIQPISSTYYTNQPFSSTVATYHINKNSNDELAKTEWDPSLIPGALYTTGPNNYIGLYRKLANPIRYLYTPEERGLSVNPDHIDPTIKDIQNAPVSITEEGTTFYVKSQAQYESFYDSAKKTLPSRIKQEQEVNYPNAIKQTVNTLKNYAAREVADFFRRTSDSALKLAKPVNYTSAGSNIFLAGTYTFSEIDQVLSSRLAYYTRSASEVDEKIRILEENIAALAVKAKANSLDPDVISSKIAAIPCFKEAAKAKPANKDCEDKVKKKLGTDPLMLRTLSGVDATMPDMNNPCYWKEFANSLNKISILPIPDITSPLFRYYPINIIIPTPVGLALIPTPQQWIPLFSLSTPLGTLVTFLTIPKIIFGIPLPSVHVMYFAPDTSKYMLFSPNVPLVYSPPNALKYGFELDESGESDNPIGLSNTNPHKGQFVKGALQVSVKLGATAEKAVRLATVAATLAAGKKLGLTGPNGELFAELSPQEYLAKYLSPLEKIAEIADTDPLKEFDLIIDKFKRTITNQLNMLGDPQLAAVTNLKAKTESARQDGVMGAENEANLKKKREAKKLARALDPISLNEKIQGVLGDFEEYLDKINLGVLAFPSDPTKINPKLPPYVPPIINLVEKAASGQLALESKPVDFKKIIKKFSKLVNLSDLKIPKKNFNINKLEDVEEFKRALKEYSKEVLEYVQGNKVNGEDLDPNMSPEKKAEIRAANELRKKFLKQAFGLPALAIQPPKLKLFDPAAPCCPVDEDKQEGLISPQALAVIAVFTAIFDAILNGLTADALKEMLGGITEFGLEMLTTMFDTILASLPPLNLPALPDFAEISKVLLVPIMQAMHAPQAPNPLGLPFPIQVVIPINVIVKPLLLAAIAYLLELILRLLSDAGKLLTSNSQKLDTPSLDQIVTQIPCGNNQVATVTTSSSSTKVTITLPTGKTFQLPKIPVLTLDIVSYFALLTSTDLKQLIKDLIFTAIDGILEPIKSVIEPILLLYSVVSSLKDLSFNIIEAGNPFILPLKLLIMAIKLQIPNSAKVKIANLDALELVKLAYIPVATAAEPVLKEVMYLAAILSCAFASKPGIKIARIAANPFVNQDDLPPWERLTHKNPLFAIFLDEIAWRSTITSTGALLFQTKMPGMFPTAYTPNVFVDSGVHF